MNSTLKTATAGQVNGLKFANAIVLNPMRVSRNTEFKMLRMMGLDRAYAWTRFFILLVPALLFLAVMAVAYLKFGPMMTAGGWFAANEVAGRGYKVATKPKTTSRRGLQKLMVQEELVKVKDGQKPPKLVILSKTEDEFGKTMRVRAMGTTVDDWKKKKHVVAVRANVPLSLCEVTEDADRPPHEFDIWIGKPGGRKTRVAVLPESTDFYEEFGMGRTLSGRIVDAQMFEVNTMVCGIQGRGKSVFVRRFILHNLLDPEGETYVIDGKGSLIDYQAAIPALSAYISVAQPDSKEALEALFDYLIAEVDRLNAAGQRARRLLVLEEWQRIGKTGDKEYDKRITAKLRIIYKLGRSTGLHVLLVTQRPSAVAIDTEIRDLFAQVICFAQKTSSSYRMALGESPEVSLPKKKGEAILSNDDETVFVLVDWLKDEVWLKACAGLAHRESVRLTPPAHESDPLAQATHAAAQRLTVKAVRPGVLYEALPVDLRPGSVAHYGRWLADLGLTKTSEMYSVAEVIEATGGN
jgi:hypothetical protein